MDVDIVPMELCHIDSVVKISEESFPVSWSKESYINEVKNPLAHYLVAIFNNKIVGFIGVWIVIGEANITNIAVSKDFRARFCKFINEYRAKSMQKKQCNRHQFRSSSFKYKGSKPL